MITVSGIRLTIVPLFGLAAMLFTSAARSLPPESLNALESRSRVSDSLLPSHAKSQSGIVGVLNPGALSAPVLRLTLADGRTIEARLQRVVSDTKRGKRSWIGTFDDAPGSILVLNRAKGVVTGVANYRDQVLEIEPTVEGKHMMFAVDSTRLPKSDGLVRHGNAAGDAAGSAESTASGTMAAAGDAVVQDVLVVYTAAAASANGQATLESKIQTAVESANQAYLNSNVAITLNVVGLQQVGVTETGAAESTLSKLQGDAAVKSLRDQVGADLVILVSQDSNWCGYANLMTSNSTSFAPLAYAVVYSKCLSNQSLAHEAGHLQGLDHDRANAAGGGVYAYSYGFRRCVSDGTGFRDIMSYPCSGANRVLLFSNPYVNYNGYPAGVAYESSATTSAENARTLNNTAATVAAFRGASNPSGPTTLPASPTGLKAAIVAYNKVSMVWTDNATNETGYKVERSPDGVVFTEIATVSADTAGYADTSVAAKTNYSYRVRAYNSAGVSSYSNALQVTIPDLPPPPPAAPTGVKATDGADGTATVAWIADTSRVSDFEVRREKWDTRKLVWGSASIVAKVPTSVLTIVDASGTGTFRYSVRAVNSGGSSGYAGPAPVTVTGNKGKPRK